MFIMMSKILLLVSLFIINQSQCVKEAKLDISEQNDPNFIFEKGKVAGRTCTLIIPKLEVSTKAVYDKNKKIWERDNKHHILKYLRVTTGINGLLVLSSYFNDGKKRLEYYGYYQEKWVKYKTFDSTTYGPEKDAEILGELIIDPEKKKEYACWEGSDGTGKDGKSKSGQRKKDKKECSEYRKDGKDTPKEGGDGKKHDEPTEQEKPKEVQPVDDKKQKEHQFEYDKQSEEEEFQDVKKPKEEQAEDVKKPKEEQAEDVKKPKEEEVVDVKKPKEEQAEDDKKPEEYEVVDDKQPEEEEGDFGIYVDFMKKERDGEPDKDQEKDGKDGDEPDRDDQEEDAKKDEKPGTSSPPEKVLTDKDVLIKFQELLSETYLIGGVNLKPDKIKKEKERDEDKDYEGGKEDPEHSRKHNCMECSSKEEEDVCLVCDHSSETPVDPDQDDYEDDVELDPELQKILQESLRKLGDSVNYGSLENFLQGMSDSEGEDNKEEDKDENQEDTKKDDGSQGEGEGKREGYEDDFSKLTEGVLTGTYTKFADVDDLDEIKLDSDGDEKTGSDQQDSKDEPKSEEKEEGQKPSVEQGTVITEYKFVHQGTPLTLTQRVFERSKDGSKKKSKKNQEGESEPPASPPSRRPSSDSSSPLSRHPSSVKTSLYIKLIQRKHGQGHEDRDEEGRMAPSRSQSDSGTKQPDRSGTDDERRSSYGDAQSPDKKKDMETLEGGGKEGLLRSRFQKNWGTLKVRTKPRNPHRKRYDYRFGDHGYPVVHPDVLKVLLEESKKKEEAEAEGEKSKQAEQKDEQKDEKEDEPIYDEVYEETDMVKDEEEYEEIEEEDQEKDTQASQDTSDGCDQKGVKTTVHDSQGPIKPPVPQTRRPNLRRGFKYPRIPLSERVRQYKQYQEAIYGKPKESRPEKATESEDKQDGSVDEGPQQEEKEEDSPKGKKVGCLNKRPKKKGKTKKEKRSKARKRLMIYDTKGENETEEVGKDYCDKKGKKKKKAKQKKVKGQKDKCEKDKWEAPEPDPAEEIVPSPDSASTCEGRRKSQRCVIS